MENAVPLDGRTDDADGAADELVKSLDLMALRQRLDARPEDVHHVDADGNHLTHHAARRGAVMVAEFVCGRGANPLANDAVGLWPAHAAAATNHPNAALFLLERATHSKTKEGPRTTAAAVRAAIQPLLDSKKNPTQNAIADVASALTGVSRRILDDPRILVKQVAQLEALPGDLGGITSEGWWQHRFLPERVRTLVAFIAEGKQGPAETQLLLGEIVTLLDAHRTAERLHALRSLDLQNVTYPAIELEAKHLSDRVLQQADGRETCVPVGWDGHAVYAGLKIEPASSDGKRERRLRVRIDNVGQGRSRAHEHDDGLVHSIVFNAPISYLESHAGRQQFDSFIKGLLLTKASSGTDEDRFYLHVARFKGALGDQFPADVVAEGRDSIALPPQTAANCTVENAQPGLYARVGKTLFEDFKQFELSYAKTLVKDLNVGVLFDIERHYQDVKGLSAILDKSGPRKRPLEIHMSRVKGRPYADVIAEHATVDQLGRVITDGDAAGLKILLKHGARADLVGAGGRSLLHLAAKEGNGTICAMLIEAGASMNCLDEDGNSPIHLAAEAGSAAAIQVLVEAGAQLDQPNSAGITARSLLQQRIKEISRLAHLMPEISDKPKKKRDIV